MSRCVGSLIDEDYVLTSARCVYQIASENIIAYVNAKYVFNGETGTVSHGVAPSHVESVTIHNEYTPALQMDKEVAVLQRKLEAELKNFKDSQKEFSKLVQTQRQLDGQYLENKSILEELQLLKPTNTVYKLYGPVLVKQELDDSKQNVAKRIEYITKELKRCSENINQLEQKQDKYRANLQKLQQQYQSQMAMAKQ
uniref:Probable prefoldin subunit 6 n=3 Tax=Nyssorhynchus TaxID=44543 RepID=A0A182FUG6_ANOAL